MYNASRWVFEGCQQDKKCDRDYRDDHCRGLTSQSKQLSPWQIVRFDPRCED